MKQTDYLVKKIDPILKQLVAPCGMNCAVCSRYLAHLNNLRRSQCIGCRPSKKKCTYLFKDCGGPRNNSAKPATFCYECEQYPCWRIDRMDKRYRTGYQTSIKENLEFIRKHGLAKFVAEQYSKHQCQTCFEMISIHNGKCFKCNPITRLVEKRSPANKK